MPPLDPWFGTSWSAVLAVLVGVFVTYAAVIVATRIAGLRSFAKISSFDFAMTVAVGTLVASTAITRDPPVAQGLVAIVALYLAQYAVGRLRIASSRFATLVDNQPVLLVRDGVVLGANLRRVRVTREELHASIRQAGLPGIAAVRAAVMETTGDISIIAGDQPVDPDLLDDVRS